MGMPRAREEKGPSTMSRVASPTRGRLKSATDSDEQAPCPPSIAIAKGAADIAESRLPLLEAQRAVEPLQPNPSVPVLSQRRRRRRGRARCSRSAKPSRWSFDARVFAVLDRKEPRNSKALHYPNRKGNTTCQPMTTISTRLLDRKSGGQLLISDKRRGSSGTNVRPERHREDGRRDRGDRRLQGPAPPDA